MNAVETLIILISLVALSTLLGLVWRARTGRIHRITSTGSTPGSTISIPGAPTFGSRVTLLQFSTEVCAPCKVTKTLLSGLASELDGGAGEINYVDIDVTSRPDLANRFNLLQSPTVFILDGNAVLRARIGGTPKIIEVQAEIEQILIPALR
jgi:thiol-disulfide isomerase/thioredoxin